MQLLSQLNLQPSRTQFDPVHVQHDDINLNNNNNIFIKKFISFIKKIAFTISLHIAAFFGHIANFKKIFQNFLYITSSRTYSNLICICITYIYTIYIFLWKINWYYLLCFILNFFQKVQQLRFNCINNVFIFTYIENYSNIIYII